jgi:hypothetical protein
MDWRRSLILVTAIPALAGEAGGLRFDGHNCGSEASIERLIVILKHFD